jgi:D-glycero-D-manno-heptose 1,7-bisphosphate phosphatase
MAGRVCRPACRFHEVYVKFWRRRSPACYGRPVADGKRALFLDWGGTLALTKDNRTVVDAAGHPVLMRNVAATLARERPHFDLCFIVSNQGRISRGEISAAEVVRRFAWANTQLGGPFTDWRLCPHGDEHGCDCRKPNPGMFLELAGAHDVALPASVHVGDSAKDRDAAARAGVGSFVWARDFFGWGDGSPSSATGEF